MSVETIVGTSITFLIIIILAACGFKLVCIPTIITPTKLIKCSLGVVFIIYKFYV